jgi:hypothetical protein
MVIDASNIITDLGGKFIKNSEQFLLEMNKDLSTTDDD